MCAEKGRKSSLLWSSSSFREVKCSLKIKGIISRTTSVSDILQWTHSRTFMKMLPLATSSLLLKILIFSTLYIVVFYISLIALDLASILTLLLIHIFTAFDYF